jgi:hypothetical protein
MSALLLLTLLAGRQQPVTIPHSSRPFAIVDNSFLVEEAFNQEPRIFQNIFGWMRQQGTWTATFTQEWPVPATRHQLSYTLPFVSSDDGRSIGDVLINYRNQVLEEGRGRPAFSPRISVQLPTGSEAAGGNMRGVQINLPFSKQQRDFYFHWNAGMTWLRTPARTTLSTPALAASAIYRMRDMCNVMVESVWSAIDTEIAPGRSRYTQSFTLSPGIRGGWNLGPDTQVIVGAAVPVSWVGGHPYGGVFGYFSYELPFRRSRSGGQ